MFIKISLTPLSNECFLTHRVWFNIWERRRDETGLIILDGKR